MIRIPVLIVSLVFFITGVAHIVRSDFFVAAMPDYLPCHLELVIISGVFELLGAIGILTRKTRLAAGYGLILLLVAVFPANVNMALHPEQFPDIPEAALYIRLPFQALIIWFVWWAIKPERVCRTSA